MCKYCTEDDYITLKRKTIKGAGLVKTDFTLDLDLSMSDGRDQDGVTTEGPYLAACFYSQNDSVWVDVHLPIQYCPFCGQKLTKEEA